MLGRTIRARSPISTIGWLCVAAGQTGVSCSNWRRGARGAQPHAFALLQKTALVGKMDTTSLTPEMLGKADVAGPAARSFAFGPFVLIPEKQSLFNGHASVRIGGRALDLLTALVEKPGELLTKRELMARAWPKTVVEEANLKVNMAALRRVLGEDPGAGQYIATVAGRGYRFIANVQPSESPNFPSENSARKSSSHGLPIRTPRVLGRDSEIDAIRLELSGSQLVSVVGPGGIGKTTVAIAAAREYGEGVAFIDLATISDCQFIPAVIASALGLGMTGVDPLAGIIHALKSQERLLIFDNCEHLLPAIVVTVDRILRNLDTVRILATSREPLRTDKERVHRLGGLECDPSGNPKAVDARKYPAVELFATRAYFRDGYQLIDTDAPAVAEICRRLDGNALAIELAATQAMAFPPREILKMLDDRLRLLKLGSPAAPLRHQSLLATLDWSFSLLTEREAMLLSAVSVFAGSFGVESAAAVANCAPTEVLDTLAQLDAKSLLATDINLDVVTYRLLETTRSYCLERLRIGGKDKVVHRRHAEHVCALLERAESEWAQRTAREWGGTYGRVIDDLRGALAWAEVDASNRSLHVRLTVAGLLLWNHLGLTEECRVRVSRAIGELEDTGLVGTAAEMKLQVWFGGVTIYTQGLMSPAMSAVRRAYDIASQIGDTDCRVRCLRLIGIHQIFNGESDAAIRTFESFDALAAAEVPSAVLEGEVAAGIAQLFVGQLWSVRTRLEHRHELDLHKNNESQRVRYISDRIGDVTNLLTQAQWLTGAPDTALRNSKAAMEYALATQHHVAIVNAISYVCPIYYWTGHYEECGRHAEMFDDLALRHGFAIRRPVAMFYRAALAGAHGDNPAEAVVGIEKAIVEFNATGHLARMPYYLAVLAENYLRLGQFDRARTTIHASRKIAQEKNDRWCVPEVLRINASLLATEGHTRQAEALLVESMTFAQDIGALSWRLRSANDLAKLLVGDSKEDDARHMLTAVLNEFSEGHSTQDLVAATVLLESLK